MVDVRRRDVLAGLVVAGGVMAATQPSRVEARTIDVTSIKKDTDVACVYHCDFGEPARIGQMITNIDNHLSVYDYDPFRAKIVVVAHGAGIKPLLDTLEGTPWAKDDPTTALYERYRTLAKLGVEVYLCQITFTRNKIDPAKAHKDDFIKLVPSGVGAIGELQSRGFAYIKVG
jgi:intracellular sulfur oxidation DsrE/DsrF family protein